LIARTLAKRIGDLMISKKAHDVVILDLKKLTSAADYFVICTADSDSQVKAVADAVRDGMEESNERVWHYEGYQALKWIVLDYVDVVAHIFYKEDRSFYNLERLWGDAKITEVQDEVAMKKPAAKKSRTVSGKSSKKKKVNRE
jgi:ribosome-associated protein